METTEILYFKVVDIWKRLCELHNELLDRTFDEYSFLLQSDMDKLEDALEEKKDVISRIGNIDSIRSELIIEVGEKTGVHINDVNELLNTFAGYEDEINQKLLKNYNSLLIDLIKKIQEQNKRNKIFINKAVLSLKEIREEVLGKRGYATYNKKGSTSKTAGGT